MTECCGCWNDGEEKILSVLYDGVRYFRWRGNRFVPSQWALRSQEQSFFGHHQFTRAFLEIFIPTGFRQSYLLSHLPKLSVQTTFNCQCNWQNSFICITSASTQTTSVSLKMKAESLTTTHSRNPNEDHHLFNSQSKNLKTCNQSCYYHHHWTCNVAGLMAPITDTCQHLWGFPKA